MAHLSDDETVAKMGHPVCGCSDLDYPALVEQTLHRGLVGFGLFGIQERHCGLFVRENPEQMDGRSFAA